VLKEKKKDAKYTLPAALKRIKVLEDQLDALEQFSSIIPEFERTTSPDVEEQEIYS